MYDGHFFAVTDNKTGYGLMQMYDVGMASMVAMSDACLAELADAAGRADTAKASISLSRCLALLLPQFFLHLLRRARCCVRAPPSPGQR